MALGLELLGSPSGQERFELGVFGFRVRWDFGFMPQTSQRTDNPKNFPIALFFPVLRRRRDKRPSSPDALVRSDSELDFGLGMKLRNC